MEILIMGLLILLGVLLFTGTTLFICKLIDIWFSSNSKGNLIYASIWVIGFLGFGISFILPISLGFYFLAK